MMDSIREEATLGATLVNQFSGEFVLSPVPASPSDEAPVDIGATNERIALHGRPLHSFTAVEASDPDVHNLERLADPEHLEPEQIALVMLVGGLSFRSKGVVNPLMEIVCPTSGSRVTLLQRQLERLAASPLAETRQLFLVGNVYNEEPLRRHLAAVPATMKPCLYVGGVAPRLKTKQKTVGPPLIFSANGFPSYNPLSHLEALRWLVIRGLLAKLLDCRVIITFSYSNWGRIFTSETLRLARFVDKQMKSNPDTFFHGEATARPRESRDGSIVARHQSQSQPLCLIKSSYGRGAFALPPSGQILVSTNTLHFSVENVLRKLERCSHLVGIPAGRDSLIQLLNDAEDGRRREQAAELFEAAFPVAPILIPGQTDYGAPFLRIERDLDQLSLLPGTPYGAVRVPNERGVFFKLPADFEDPAKLTLLFSQ